MISNQNTSQPTQPVKCILSGEKFLGWESLNDTIMGGDSQACCKVTSEGLLLYGEVIEENGGFVSCRSPVFTPPLNLFGFSALRLEVEGNGRTLKLALACGDGLLGLSEIIYDGLRWVASVPTKSNGLSFIDIPFDSLQPTVRARPISLPLRFNCSCITRFQLLHSKFGESGDLNPGFRPGPIRVLLRSISAVP